MSEHTWNVIAIIIYMSVMLGIGYWSYRQTDEYEDYVLAGRGLNPFVAALSAGAADMSGWLHGPARRALRVGHVRTVDCRGALSRRLGKLDLCGA